MAGAGALLVVSATVMQFMVGGRPPTPHQQERVTLSPAEAAAVEAYVAEFVAAYSELGTALEELAVAIRPTEALFLHRDAVRARCARATTEKKLRLMSSYLRTIVSTDPDAAKTLGILVEATKR